MVFALRALIINAGWWVGTHHKKARARGETSVPGTSGKDSYVASLEMECSAIVAAKADRAIASSDAKYLVNARMVVHVVVDFVAPRIAPAVSLEEIFDDAGSRSSGRATAPRYKTSGQWGWLGITPSSLNLKVFTLRDRISFSSWSGEGLANRGAFSTTFFNVARTAMAG